MINTLGIIFLLLASCGNKGERFAAEIDIHLYPLLVQFEADAKTHGKIVTFTKMNRVVWSDQLEPGIAGVCYQYEDSEGTEWYDVEISDRFKQRPEVVRGIMYHELGHCELRLPHSKTYLSIMNSSIHSKETYALHWTTLVRNLFTQGR